MPTVNVAPALARWVPGQKPGTTLTESVPGETLRDVFEKLFEKHPACRGYVLDELGRLRHHVVLFVDGAAISDKENLSARVSPSSDIYIFQALSGG